MVLRIVYAYIYLICLGVSDEILRRKIWGFWFQISDFHIFEEPKKFFMSKIGRTNDNSGFSDFGFEIII